MQRVEAYQKLMSIFLLCLLVFGFQNCAEGFRAPKGADDLSSLSENGGDDSGGGDSGDDNEVVPVKPIPTINSWSDPFPAGVESSDCLNDDDYNMCLVYKNPVFSNGGKFSPPFTSVTSNPAIEARIFTYALKVPASGQLQNSHFQVIDANQPDPESLGGSWKFTYQGDNYKYHAQMASFYWLNRQLTFMEEQTGKYFLKNKQLKIIAYSSDTKDNAYFNGTHIVLGYRDTGSNGKVDVALDAGVVSHEAGHGNLHYAVRSSGGFTQRCPSYNGCFSGIHEGQADVHTFILFPETDILGEHFVNDSRGLRSPAAIKDLGYTALSLYNKRSGEVHDMGEVYASIWWEVWEKAKSQNVNKDVEIIFTNHLAGMSGYDNFTTAFEVIEAMAQQTSGDANQIVSDFQAEYNRMGVTLP